MRDFSRRSEEANALHRQFANEDYEQTREDLKQLLKLPAFRRVFIGIIKRAGVYGSLKQEMERDIAVGYRELGVEIYMAANTADGDMVVQAIKERNEIERDRRSRFESLVEKKGN